MKNTKRPTVTVTFENSGKSFVIKRFGENDYRIYKDKEHEPAKAGSLREAFDAIGMYMFSIEKDAALLN